MRTVLSAAVWKTAQSWITTKHSVESRCAQSGIRWRALGRDSNGWLSRNYRAGCGKSGKTSGQNVNTEEKMTLEVHHNLFISGEWFGIGICC